MTCLEAQSLITKYLNNELSDEELKGFLDHINSCENCSEELEIYYTVITGFRQLDADVELTDNFALALKKKLALSRLTLARRVKRRHRRVVYLAIVVCILTPLFLGIESSQVSDKTQIVYTDVEKSDYELKYNFSYNFDELDEYTRENEEEIRSYVTSVTDLEENDGKDIID